MKYKSHLIYPAFWVVLFVCLLSCNKQSPFSNKVFITAAITNPYTSIAADSTGAELAVRVSSSDSVSAVSSVTLKTDTSLVAAYNELSGKQYLPMPEGSYTLNDNTVTIQPGTATSSAATLRIISTKGLKEGASYLIPVTIGQSDLPMIHASKTLYVEVKPIIIAKYVAQTSGNYFTCDFSKNNDGLKAMTAVTMETRLLVNKFQPYSPYISSVMGIEGSFLFRFGDVTVDGNTLQFIGPGTGNIPGFSTGVWYHIAVVFNGSSTKVYVNGEEKLNTPASGTVDLTSTSRGGFHLGYSYNGRLMDGLMSETRVWSRALTQAELINGMCGVDPASKDLVAYWKLNEGTGQTAHDLTGNGHDAQASKVIVWKEGVRCN